MPNIINLKFKGNKSFLACRNLSDSESLTKTWKVCTKVASYLEHGQRLENLSWRLWHLQNLLVYTDNGKSKRDFKKLSKCMDDGPDKERGPGIEDLEASDYKHSHSPEYMRQHSVEKERSREASQNANPDAIKRMQFTLSVDQPSLATDQPVEKPTSRPRVLHFKYDYKRMHSTTSARDTTTTTTHSDDIGTAAGESNGKNLSATPAATKPVPQSVRFPPYFSNDFGPSALLFLTPTVTNGMNYGEALTPSTISNDRFSIPRPTIELPLDEILNNVEDTAVLPSSVDPPFIAPKITPVSYVTRSTSPFLQQQEEASGMARLVAERHENDMNLRASSSNNLLSSQYKEGIESSSAVSQANQEISPEMIVLPQVNLLVGGAHSDRFYSLLPRSTPPVKSQSTGSPRPGATATNSTRRSISSNNLAPGGGKAECSNCGATHTPLWRRGLNDELNCNACGLYFKLHKCPRPKSMRNRHGEGRVQAVPRQGIVDVMAQCYNCRTTVTPLWRKDGEGNTVCNACGLYNRSHGSHRPLSMKSGLKRKRSRYESSRGNPSEMDMPSASTGVNRSPLLIHNQNNNGDISDVDITMGPRSPKRRSMSTGSASEPPSSPASYSSF